MLPNFIYVGGSKCGSSWIYEILREHPEVFVPDAKDIMYFDRHRNWPIGWYEAFFDAAGGAEAVGELSHDYFLFADIADRIFELMPNAKILACLREPVSRTASRWHYARSTDLDRRVPFSEYASRPEIVRENRYLQNLRPFYQRFPQENILTMLYDDLLRYPVSFCKSIYSFLRVDADFEPTHLHRRVLPARVARVGSLAPLLWKSGKLLRDLGLANAVGRVKRAGWFEQLFYRPLTDKPVHSDEDVVAIRSRTIGDYPELEVLIGRSLPRPWYGE